MTRVAPFNATHAIGHTSSVDEVVGLDAEVRIRRDSLGIPHIEASTVSDLFFGQGFATAQDRLWQLERDRLRALGRSAELIGSAVNIVNDGFHRRARLGEYARSGYDGLDVATKGVLDSHAAGVNAFLTSTNARPVEFQALEVPDEPWEGWHAIAIFLVRHVTFATWQTKLWNARVFAALGPDLVRSFRIEGSSGDTPLIVPPGARDAVGALIDAGLFAADGVRDALSTLEPLGLQVSGSNAWAVHGSRTASGHPLVSGDPHRPFEVPNVYYQVHLTGPDIDAAGFSFPGVPGIQHFAQTPHVAWAVTNAMADYQDLFIERLPDAAIDQRTESITVRDGNPVEVECALTGHGPVILGNAAHGIGIALASTGLFEAGGSLRTILPLFAARSVADLDRTLNDWVEPANNFVLADAEGHIAYRTAGRLPVRHHLNSVLPVPGWEPDHDWAGYIPDADLPRAVDPDTGAIVTANQRVTSRDYPHLLNDDAAPPHRAERIWARLADRDQLSVDDQIAIQLDTVSGPGLTLAQQVLRATGDPKIRSILERWDGAMAADSAAGALIGQIKHELCILVVGLLPTSLTDNPFSRWEPPATALSAVIRVSNAIGNWIAADDSTITGQPSWDPLIAEASSRAFGFLTQRFGDDPSRWQWGNLHEATPLHPARGLDDRLDTLVRPTSGPLSGASDCVMAMNQIGGVTTNAMTGSTARYVWDLSDRDNSRWASPLGASGHPASPHFRDQTTTWATGTLQTVFDPITTSATTLTPSAD